jgi:hypothetical protein
MITASEDIFLTGPIDDIRKPTRHSHDGNIHFCTTEKKFNATSEYFVQGLEGTGP